MSTENTVKQYNKAALWIVGAIVVAMAGYAVVTGSSWLTVVVPALLGAGILMGMQRHSERVTERWAPLAAELRHRMPGARIAGARELLVACNGVMVHVEYMTGSREDTIKVSAHPASKLTQFDIMPTSLLGKSPPRSIDLAAVPEFDRHFTVLGDDTTTLRALWTPGRQQAYLDLVTGDETAKFSLIGFNHGSLNFMRQGTGDAAVLHRAVEFVAELASPEALPPGP